MTSHPPPPNPNLSRWFGSNVDVLRDVADGHAARRMIIRTVVVNDREQTVAQVRAYHLVLQPAEPGDVVNVVGDDGLAWALHERALAGNELERFATMPAIRSHSEEGVTVL